MTLSCILLFLSIDHIEKGPGPKSTHARERDDAARLAEAAMSNAPEEEEEKNEDLNAPTLFRQQSVDGTSEDATVAASTPIGGR